MPNWCTNEIEINGTREDIAAIWELIKNDMNILQASPDETDAEDMGVDYDAFAYMEDESIYWTGGTAWRPPTEAMQNICKKWPSLTVKMKYYEAGDDYAGRAKVDADNIEEENYRYLEGVYRLFPRETFQKEVDCNLENCDDCEEKQELIKLCSSFLPSEEIQQMIEYVFDDALPY